MDIRSTPRPAPWDAETREVVNRYDVGQFIKKEAKTCPLPMTRVSLRECVRRRHHRHEDADEEARDSLRRLTRRAEVKGSPMTEERIGVEAAREGRFSHRTLGEHIEDAHDR